MACPEETGWTVFAFYLLQQWSPAFIFLSCQGLACGQKKCDLVQVSRFSVQ